MKPWLRPLPFALVAAYGLSRASRATIDDAAPSPSAALCTALSAQSVTCSPDDVVWVTGATGVSGAMRGKARALVRGRDTDDAVDLFSVSARLSPEGQLLDLGDTLNLTHSNGADETVPIVRGSLVAYLVEIHGRPEAVNVLDLAGHDAQAYDELSRFQRFQVKVADLQQFGDSRGVKKTVFGLVPSPERATLAFRPDGTLEVKTFGGSGQEGDKTVVIDPAKGELVEGAAYARVTPEVVSRPPTFAPWMSDRLRGVSWFGDEKNQALKAVVFTAGEWIKAKKAKLTGDHGEKEAQEDMAAVGGGGVPASFIDPEIGWPPKNLEPVMKPPIAGEGQWVTLDKDAFITPIPGVATPFVTTFVRTDPGAQQTRVYVTLWDPRLVALHMEAGTVEPVGATGAAGPGQIARTPEVIRRVVGGFNGGFQVTHGEFGMQANGVLYLPPKAYAATVVELRDGTTAFGAWPPKSHDVPDDFLSFRQNMTALVQNGKYNPWGRPWWGGVPPGWHDAIHTTRSGICLTKEGFVGYFFGHDIGPEPLGRAMLAARCAFGIHLDMNPGLAGFEFYNMQPASTFQPLGRPLQTDWEFEGPMKDMPEFKFRARRMIKSMGHINFPRYIHREARDFFYLTVRPVLPGHPLAAQAAPDGEGAWRVKGLPQHGYPYASAITALRLAPPSGKRVRVMRLDPRTMSAADGGANDESARAGGEAPVVAVFGKPPHPPAAKHAGRDAGHAGAPSAPSAPPSSERKLFLRAHVFSIEKAAPQGAVAIADVAGPAAPAAGEARAAVGISDEDGMLQWVELLPEDQPDGATSEAMLAVLEKNGCGARGLVTNDVRAYLGGSLDIGGDAAAPASIVARLVRTPAPGARSIFESTEIVPQAVWQPLQSQKVKWRPTLAPPEKSGAPGSTGAPNQGSKSPGSGPTPR